MASQEDPVADMLGVRTSEAFLLMSEIKHGLSRTSLDRVVHAVAPTDKAFARQIVARATLARRRRALAPRR
jgi:uncharacterized protein (DUF2384 family)